MAIFYKEPEKIGDADLNQKEDEGHISVTTYEQDEQKNHRERNQESNLYHFLGGGVRVREKNKRKFETNARRANPWNIEHKRDTGKRKGSKSQILR